mmetsp:Transcript_88157/g.254269  ORF Transcript_88157/g.254269 Transcript_88157/m.254269 type:complete len:256 (+) Transcript_88157:91-858(+)
MAALGHESSAIYGAAGRGGRWIVKFTFLDFEEFDDEQPASVPRSRTDSILWNPERGLCREYRPVSPSAATPPASDVEQQEDERGAAAERQRIAESDRAECPAASRVTPQEPCGERRTTLMMRNLPNDYTREMLLDLLSEKGFARAYDFVYLPVDFDRGCGLGYAFVNLVDVALVQAFRDAFDGYTNWTVRSSKVCRASWSDRDQGLWANLRRYRNSPVMHPSVPDAYKPCLYSGGERVPFPVAKKQLRPPGKRKA